MLMTYAMLLNSPGGWKQANAQQPIGVVSPVISYTIYNLLGRTRATAGIGRRHQTVPAAETRRLALE